MAKLQRSNGPRDSRHLRVLESGSVHSGQLSGSKWTSSGHSSGTRRPLQPISCSFLSLRARNHFHFVPSNGTRDLNRVIGKMSTECLFVSDLIRSRARFLRTTEHKKRDRPRSSEGNSVLCPHSSAYRFTTVALLEVLESFVQLP